MRDCTPRDPVPLDAVWRSTHPMPNHGHGTDKNDRGRVLLVGGSMFVPGALGLTGEAVLRSGAGKLQIATVDAAAMHLGVLVPEAAMIGLDTGEDGEIGPGAAAVLADAARHCHALLIGPGMVSEASGCALIDGLLPSLGEHHVAVLDAAAICAARAHAPLIAGLDGRAILTPHHGEMAKLTGITAEAIGDDPVACAQSAACLFNAVIVLKSSETVIAAPGGETLVYTSDCVGLATGGSGDVLAGIIAGLAAQGAEPFAAASWGVWLHGQAGLRAAERIGPIGFLARDLPGEIPALRAQAQGGE